MTLLPVLLASLCVLATTPADDVERAKQIVHPSVWRLFDDGIEPLKVWVFLTDKGLPSAKDRTTVLARTKAAMSSRTIQRRRLRRTAPGLIDLRDIRPHSRYVDQVLSVGVKLHVQSRWLNALSVTATADQIGAIAKLPFVRAIQPVRRGRPTSAVPIESPHPIQHAQRKQSGGFYGLSEEQLQQIGIIDMHSAGFTGSGVIIGVLDTGFSRTHNAYNDPDHPIDIVAEIDVINGDGSTGIDKGDPSGQHWHGTLVLSVIGGYEPSVMMGGAYDASFILAKTEDISDEYPMEEDFYVAGLEFIEANGADVATSSLGYIDWYTWFDLDGLTAVTTIAVNVATANGLACCTAAGNGGHDSDLPTLLAPADAFKVLTCGAVNAAGEIAGFSSNGPTADGRVKPEVLARGVGTVGVDPNDDTQYITASGTSLSTPLLASAVALLIEAHPNWTVDQIRTALFQTADYYVANGVYDPEYRRGYGVIDVFAAAQVSFCGADLDGDSLVAPPDLAMLLGSWGACPGCPADIDGDGDVGPADLAILLGAWGPCP